MDVTFEVQDVLTMEEAANYLRLPQETLARQAAEGITPGGRIEDSWCFLKTALDDWLRRQDSRAILIQQAGALADDATLPDLRAMIFQARRRPETAADPVVNAPA